MFFWEIVIDVDESKTDDRKEDRGDDGDILDQVFRASDEDCSEDES